MHEIDLNKDVWPFLKFMTLMLTGYGVGTPKDIVDEWSQNGRLYPNTDLTAMGSPLSVKWGINHRQNILHMLIAGEARNLLMFRVLSMNTKADVLLKDLDVLYFVDPHFNAMLREERARKLGKKTWS